MPPKRISQTNPQPTLTQEDVDQLVRDGIETAIRAERERVKMEATRARGPAGGPAAAPMARECSFTGFIKCGPTQFHGTEGVVGLVRCFKKMENTFKISECAEGKKVKFDTATLHSQALTWWNSQVATLGREVANGRPWTEVKQMMTDKFCLTEEVQRLEDELRPLKLRDMNIDAYTERMGHKANDCRSKNVASGATVQSNIVCYECEERGHKSRACSKKADRRGGNVQGQAYVIRDAEHNQGPNVVMAAHTERFNELALLCPDVVPNEKKKVELYINGLPEIIKGETNSSRPATLNEAVRMAHALMEERVHKSRACPKKADRRGGNMQGQAYVIRDAEHNQGLNVVTGMFLLNNCYATMLFDSGADKSFMDIKFSHLIDIKPVKLNSSYEVELANKTLGVKSDSSVSRLKVISCIKARKYIERGSLLFIAQVTEKEPTKKQLHVIDSNGVHVDPAKVEAIRNWSAPTTPMEKNKKYEWGMEEEEAFQTLKQKLCSAYILALTEGTENFIEYCDASLKGFGVVLMQREKKELNMSQRRWIELLRDYDCEIRYHLMDSIEKLAQQYLKEIVYRRGVPVSIISDRESLFTSRF
uniref:CCHC-type domain-containing protein n=1 Tax=Tanacetum cinerariifolium TaxID=118510 RepID=A0A6L2KD87_TANCI|nr:hypothetical protein [Tanacetum cinerariifolium]